MKRVLTNHYKYKQIWKACSYITINTSKNWASFQKAVFLQYQINLNPARQVKTLPAGSKHGHNQVASVHAPFCFEGQKKATATDESGSICAVFFYLGNLPVWSSRRILDGASGKTIFFSGDLPTEQNHEKNHAPSENCVHQMLSDFAQQNHKKQCFQKNTRNVSRLEKITPRCYLLTPVSRCYLIVTDYIHSGIYCGDQSGKAELDENRLLYPLGGSRRGCH